jgi:regulator of nucleoside diphosphate kinase
MNTKTVMVTHKDYAGLMDLLSARAASPGRDQLHLERLREEIERANVVPSALVDPDVITMNSRVKLRDLESNSAAVYTLVYPKEADISRGKVSVLAPLGTAMLGCHEGDCIEWETPRGNKRWKVEFILYQPEAAGELSAPGDFRPAPTARPVQ